MKVERRYWNNGKLKYEAVRNEKDRLHGISKRWYEDGQLEYEYPYQESEVHGVAKFWGEGGQPSIENHYLYGNYVTKEEYRKHELIERLSGI